MSLFKVAADNLSISIATSNDEQSFRRRLP